MLFTPHDDDYDFTPVLPNEKSDLTQSTLTQSTINVDDSPPRDDLANRRTQTSHRVRS